MSEKAASYLCRINRWDLAWCLRINQAGRRAWVRSAFGAVSRLGDGVFWYGLMLALLVLRGWQAVIPVAHMLVVGAVCLLVYKWLKGKTLRPRPSELNREIFLGAAPLDQFSFPSGHTLHAVGFSVVALAYFPMLAWLVVPFTLLVAASRLVLGLHYPTDVLAGAAIGASIASASFGLW
jgi:undecaprenyl-diphosphatase